MFMKSSIVFILIVLLYGCQSSSQANAKQQISEIQYWIDSVQAASIDNQALDSLSWTLLNDEFNDQLNNINLQDLNSKETEAIEATKLKWMQFDRQYHLNMQTQIDSFLRAATQDSINADTTLYQ